MRYNLHQLKKLPMEPSPIGDNEIVLEAFIEDRSRKRRLFLHHKTDN